MDIVNITALSEAEVATILAALRFLQTHRDEIHDLEFSHFEQTEIRDGILGVLRIFLAALVAESIGEIKTAVLTGKPIEEMYEFFVWQVEACIKIAALVADRSITHFDIG